MINTFDKLLSQCNGAFLQARTHQRAKQLAYGAMTCLGKHTVTGMLTAGGSQFVDWTSAYRLFQGDRIDTQGLYDVVCKNVLEDLEADQMIVGHMDDTLLRKTGRKVTGTAWRRDPLGPPFHTNFIWGQRFLQLSLALPQHDGLSPSRAIPVDFHHSPTAKKPGKNGSEKDWIQYKEAQKEMNLSKQGHDRIQRLREKLDEHGAKDRQLVLSVDGSYTNRTVLKQLPERVTLIGRIRKDACLYKLPEAGHGVGRNRVYGDQLPTPEQIRQSDQCPWQSVKAWAAGKQHNFDVKVVKGVRWRTAGAGHDLQLVVIRPLRYRLTKNSPLLYRRPAYLICTDEQLDIEKLLQAYLWRWEIEVNFRDEKNLLGCGQAQVRKEKPVEKVPAFIVAIYALLLLAANKTAKHTDKVSLPRPRWHPKKAEQRHSSSDIINLLRTQLWARGMGINFSHFVDQQKKIKSLRKVADPLTSALFYVRK